ncbi:MAG: sigma-70 family RNA polymerase sigma factor, partial [Actinomycetota bacterium]
ANAELEATLGRIPTDDEDAAHLGLDMEELHDLVNQISFVSVMALEESVGGGDERGESRSLLDTLADVANPEASAGLEGHELRGMLAASINELSERERMIVTLYYFEGLTLAEIGEILGVTESRICQIHTKAVGRLRKSLADEGDL